MSERSPCSSTNFGGKAVNQDLSMIAAIWPDTDQLDHSVPCDCNPWACVRVVHCEGI